MATMLCIHGSTIIQSKKYLKQCDTLQVQLAELDIHHTESTIILIVYDIQNNHPDIPYQ